MQVNNEDIPDADAVADQLIEEVKMSHRISKLESGEVEERTEYHSRGRRRSLSPPEHQRRSCSSSRSPHYKTDKTIEKDKKYTEYASDSDFSSESD